MVWDRALLHPWVWGYWKSRFAMTAKPFKQTRIFKVWNEITLYHVVEAGHALSCGHTSLGMSVSNCCRILHCWGHWKSLCSGTVFGVIVFSNLIWIQPSLELFLPYLLPSLLPSWLISCLVYTIILVASYLVTLALECRWRTLQGQLRRNHLVVKEFLTSKYSVHRLIQWWEDSIMVSFFDLVPFDLPVVLTLSAKRRSI